MINYHYLAVKRRTPQFNPCHECFRVTMIWIHFPYLNMMYYEEGIIWSIVATVGKPIKVDMTTRLMERRQYARVCVEVDLAHLVAEEV